MTTLLSNRYQVLRVLGSGGFGQTFLAEDTQMPSRRICVIKQLKAIADNPDIYKIVRDRFQREAATLEALGKDNGLVPELYASFCEDNEFYLVQEWIDGKDLSDIVHSEGCLTETKVKRILLDLLPTLGYIHEKGIIHRDIKPENIILRNRDRLPVLIDFGAVKATLATAMTAQGDVTCSVVIGTPTFMPSEQAIGRVGFASDLYSLGLTAIFLLTGKLSSELDTDPQTGELSWQRYADNFSPAFVGFLDKAIRLNFRDRYATANEMLATLRSLFDDSTTIITMPQQNSSSENAENNAITLESTEGQVAIDSQFYIQSGYEPRCYEEIKKAGSLLRIKSPHRMGKSSLMARIINHAEFLGYRTAILNLEQTNQKIFADPEKFMQWFCASVGKALGVRVKTEEYWDDIFGANDNCTDYFEKYLLEGNEQPLAIAIDNFDRVFSYPEIETDFCGLLRGWYERSRSHPLWGKLRLIIVHSQEPYAQRDINQSPFNVGFPVELSEFTTEQVRELVKHHKLIWSDEELQQFMELIGGHPYLVRSALYRIASRDITLTDFLRTAPTEAGIYSSYLMGHLKTLEDYPELGEAMQKVVAADVPVRLRSEISFKLDSQGLVSRIDNNVTPRCLLYKLYFRDRLGGS
ncbi:AAA-like domain-containing protein [Pseudanabaena sp. BC1403]|uniref:AAA-like domain-containing protein n=1 Tax=Pseudanabaena sp. BC1403 TaxID=2043171 RepID=UPI000CD9BCBA|nr:AAA-like domain-containing protein [Pseudanabaena sp. BC1403]